MPTPKKNVAKYIGKEITKRVVAKKSTLVKVQPKPNLKASPKSNVKVIPTGPLTPKQAEAKRIAKAKLRMMEINKKNPSWDK